MTYRLISGGKAKQPPRPDQAFFQWVLFLMVSTMVR